MSKEGGGRCRLLPTPSITQSCPHGGGVGVRCGPPPHPPLLQKPHR